MQDDLSSPDPKAVWQNQMTETPAMTLKLIQRKGRELHARNRRKLLGTLAGPLAAIVLYALGIRAFPTLWPILHPLFAFALAWSLLGLYFLSRGMWSAMLPGDAGLSGGVQFCRQEIERRRRFLQRVLLWSFAPVLLAIGTFILALAMIGTADRGILPNGLPFLALVVLWIIGYFVIRFQEQRELKREIEELKDIELENSR
jgi:hypothetical protein